MRAALLVLVAALVGCSWSNALYRARQLAGQAERAERQDRGFDAAALWGQVAVKAESASAHRGSGAAAAEARWLQGRALARLGDCDRATPVLAAAAIEAGDADWAPRVRLDLVRCRMQSGDWTAALGDLESLRASDDDAVREEARVLAGRALIGAGQWSEALSELAADQSADGRWQRAMAAAHLGRVSDVLELLEAPRALSDTTLDWTALFRAAGEGGAEPAESLFAEIGTMATVDDAMRLRWRFAIADGLIVHDTARGNALRRELLGSANLPTVLASPARVSLAQQRLAAAHDSASLSDALDAARAWRDADPTSRFILRPLVQAAEQLHDDIAAYPAGAAEGDLAFFADALLARDTLMAPQLGDWLLRELERRWPASPYLAKALLARIVMVPDSADALRARLAPLADSPYLRYLAGGEGPAFRALEDSLESFLLSRRLTAPPRGDDGLTQFE